jgi:hypothetical protein
LPGKPGALGLSPGNRLAELGALFGTGWLTPGLVPVVGAGAEPTLLCDPVDGVVIVPAVPGVPMPCAAAIELGASKVMAAKAEM